MHVHWKEKLVRKKVDLRLTYWYIVKSYEYSSYGSRMRRFRKARNRNINAKTWNKNYNFSCCYFTISCNIFDLSLFRLSHQYLDFSLFRPSLCALWFYVLPSIQKQTTNNNKKYLIQVNWNVYLTQIFLKWKKKYFVIFVFVYVINYTIKYWLFHYGVMIKLTLTFCNALVKRIFWVIPKTHHGKCTHSLGKVQHNTASRSTDCWADDTLGD